MTTTTADMSQHPQSAGGSPSAGPYRIHPKAIRARRNRRLLVVAGLVLVATVAYLVHWYTHDRFWVRTDNAYVTGNLVPVAAQASGIAASPRPVTSRVASTPRSTTGSVRPTTRARPKERVMKRGYGSGMWGWKTAYADSPTG